MSRPLKEVALLFLRLGATSFGGPAAYISLMHHEVVVRRRWLDDQRFLDLSSATMLLPGPNATEIASHLGFIRAGWRGLITAGGLFILPGTAAVMVVAWAYVKFGSLPQVTWVLYGIKPAVIAVIVQAIWSLGKRGIKGPLMAAVGLGTLGLYLVGLDEIALLFAGAAVVLLVRSGRRFFRRSISPSSDPQSMSTPPPSRMYIEWEYGYRPPLPPSISQIRSVSRWIMFAPLLRRLRRYPCAATPRTGLRWNILFVEVERRI